jgi:uncharacterized protein (TIGR03437 family)
LVCQVLVSGALAGTFGRVVPIGGHGADLAVDERRGVVYVANLTANRIEVVSTADKTLRSAINVAWQPASIALSPDGRYLVVTHFWNFQPSSPAPVTVLDLDGNVSHTYTLGALGLAVAFGAQAEALILTTQDFRLLDPATGRIEVLETIAGVVAKTLPAPVTNIPPDFVQASVAASADGQWIYGMAEAEDKATVLFRYQVALRQISAITVTATPPLGPRVISVNQDGTAYLAGWGLCDRRGVLLAQFRNPLGALGVGGHAIDSVRGVIYAQVPEAPATTSGSTAAPTGTTPTPTEPPALTIAEADNLAVRERLQLPENLAGKAVLSSDRSVMYAISASGLMILPVGSLAQTRRVTALQEDVVFRGSFCERRVLTQDIDLVDPGGGATDFLLSTTTPGISISPASGVTPAKVRVAVDMNAFQNQRGTLAAQIEVRSATAINLPSPVRVLINSREPDQRGTVVNVPGKLVDVLSDPFRDRFYVLRQDKNQVLVFDGSDYRQIATLRTGNTPTQMTMTLDGQYLLVGNDNSQIVNVHELNRLQQEPPIAMPLGHYPRSVAASGSAILAASRVAGPVHTIDRINLFFRMATTLPSLGVWENKIHINTVLAGTPSGSSILAAMADGNVMLYSAAVDTFTISRKDFKELSGAYAAAGGDLYLVGSSVLNSSLVQVTKFETDSGTSSGFAFMDQFGVKTTAPASPNPGVIQRVDLECGASLGPTRMTEAPLVGEPGFVFTRTLAPLANRKAVIALTTSGFTVLAWNYDAAVGTPRLESVVNVADQSEAVASGGLVRVRGIELSPVSLATRQLPLPTALAESCLTVNGAMAPMFSLAPGEIMAQLPFQVAGNATLILRTPSAISNGLTISIRAAAPSVFRSGTAGPETGLATVIRAKNNGLVTPSNPVHPEDTMIIYATGLGRTAPPVEDGAAGPSDPLARALVQPEVTLGGVSLPVSYAGLVPGEVGVYQINVVVPSWVPLGMEVPLSISQGGYSTSLNVRVVK